MGASKPATRPTTRSTASVICRCMPGVGYTADAAAAAAATHWQQRGCTPCRELCSLWPGTASQWRSSFLRNKRPAGVISFLFGFSGMYGDSKLGTDSKWCLSSLWNKRPTGVISFLFGLYGRCGGTKPGDRPHRWDVCSLRAAGSTSCCCCCRPALGFCTHCRPTQLRVQPPARLAGAGRFPGSRCCWRCTARHAASCAGNCASGSARRFTRKRRGG